MAALTPHSFVLADLFDVLGMSLDVPDHVLEHERDLKWIACPCCKGERYLEIEGSAWGEAARLWNRSELNVAFKLCSRCHGEGEVLEPVDLSPNQPGCAKMLGSTIQNKLSKKRFSYPLAKAA